MPEESTPKKKKMKGLRVLLPFMPGHVRFFVAATLVSALSILLNFLMPQVVRVTVDSVIGDAPFNLPAFIVRFIEGIGGREFLRANIWISAVLAVVFAVLSCLCTFLYRLFVSKGSEGVIRSMRNTLYRHIQHLPYKWHVSIQTGDIIQRCTSDVDVVRNFLASQLTELFRIVILVVFALSFMFSMDAMLTVITAAFIPFTVTTTAVFYGAIAKRFKIADEAEGELSSCVQENLTGVRVVRAFGQEAAEIQRFEEKNDLFTGLWIKLGKTMSLFWSTGGISTGLMELIVVAVGSYFAVSGRLLLGEYLVFLYYASMIAWPVRAFGRILGDLSKMGVSLDRLGEILNEPEEVDDPNGKTPDMSGDIVFEDVSFAYDGGGDVLSHLSFTIPGGSTFGVLGSTGSGKSTLTYLLTRLYDLAPGCGRITVGGVDIREMRLSHVRKNIGLVLQEPFLFSRTIAENIASLERDAPMEEIREAARIAALDETVLSFDKGYDTVIGERGVTLSGGQRQRVAIARMLMQKTPIMVFDDSLSAVDALTDQKIRAALAAREGKATTIIISHRITTLMHADCILLLKNGEIAEIGNHEELLQKNGLYKRVYDLQGGAERASSAN
jgi:ATP-binding cassette subfamily B protein